MSLSGKCQGNTFLLKDCNSSSVLKVDLIMKSQYIMMHSWKGSNNNGFCWKWHSMPLCWHAMYTHCVAVTLLMYRTINEAFFPCCQFCVHNHDTIMQVTDNLGKAFISCCEKKNPKNLNKKKNSQKTPKQQEKTQLHFHTQYILQFEFSSSN